MNSIKFDNSELNNTTYYTRFVKHESFPDRSLNSVARGSDDGDILISDRFGKKIISMQGILVGTSQADMESKKDIMSELFSRKQKNLDIDWNGTTRRYIATCSNLKFDRDHYNINYVPWSAEFTISDGVGKDTSLTAAKHAVDVNSSPYVISPAPVFAGSAKPKPIITFEIGAGHTNPCGIMVENTDNGQKLIINKQTALASGDTVVINYETKKVTIEGVEVGFYGVFPEILIGTNNIRVTVGDIIDQEFIMTDTGAGWIAVYDTQWLAQGFAVQYTDATYRKFWLWLARNGTPAADLTIRIETDAGGKPSGTLVDANAEKDITYLAVGNVGSPLFANIEFPGNFTLEAGKQYWIVLKSPGSASSANRYYVYVETAADATYPNGIMVETVDGGSTWVDYTPVANMGFKVCYGGTVDGSIGTITLDIDYYKHWL